MVYQKNSNKHYVSLNSLVADIQPSVDRISSVFIRSREEHLEDCRQTLYMHVIETYNDSSNSLPWQQLINKMWWRAMDFVKRDSGFNFWRNHIPLSDRIPVSVVHSGYIGRYIKNPSAEASLDIQNVIDYASVILSERDFIILLLHIEGLSISEISSILDPDSTANKKSANKVSSAIWRMRNRLKLIME